MNTTYSEKHTIKKNANKSSPISNAPLFSPSFSILSASLPFSAPTFSSVRMPHSSSFQSRISIRPSIVRSVEIQDPQKEPDLNAESFLRTFFSFPLSFQPKAFRLFPALNNQAEEFLESLKETSWRFDLDTSPSEDVHVCLGTVQKEMTEDNPCSNLWTN